MANARLNGFIRGFGGMFSFIDVLNRRLFAESAAEADAEAIREAWEEVGGYMYEAMGVYAHEAGTYVDENGVSWSGNKASNRNSSS